MKEFFVAIHKDSPIGALMLQNAGKVGGASSTMDAGGVSHPVIICHSIDYSRSPLFVAMTQLQDPGAGDPLPREIAVPASALLAFAEVVQSGNQPPAAQQTPGASIH